MQIEDMPRVTVAIPTFNRLELLKRAISSALKQNYKNLEIIVSDNASSDGTSEYLKSIDDVKIKVILGEQNLGMVANWDCCLAKASGEYFLLMSDDDALIDVNAIEKLVNGFLHETGKTIGAVFSDVMLERVEQKILEKTTYANKICKAEDILVDFFSNKVSIFPCSTLLRTEDIRSLGGYSSFGAKLAVDACTWISLVIKYGHMYHIAEPLLLYRIHQSLSSSSIDVWSDDFVTMNNLIEKSQVKFSVASYLKIKTAINSAWNRIPIGYISRKYRNDSNYGIYEAAVDILKLRKRLLSIGNFKFVLSRLTRSQKSTR